MTQSTFKKFDVSLEEQALEPFDTSRDLLKFQLLKQLVLARQQMQTDKIDVRFVRFLLYPTSVRLLPVDTDVDYEVFVLVLGSQHEICRKFHEIVRDSSDW